MLNAWLHGSPSTVPRFFKTPSFHKKASIPFWLLLAVPTTSPASLIEYATPNGNKSEKVFRSVSTPLLQRNGWLPASPGRFDEPTTWPRLFIHCGDPKVPPKPPRSIILPFLLPVLGLQTKGSTVGTPVDGFGTKLVKDQPATAPWSLMIQAALSGPPNVPKSRMTPLFQRKAWV